MVSKDAFWQAFIVAAAIFGIGVILGFFLEAGRTSSVEYNLLKSEINVLDEQLREQLNSQLEISCPLAIDSMFSFADSIYGEAQQLEKYDSSAKFTKSIEILHKRYDLLRMLIFAESIKLKNRCKSDFHTLLYLYDYKTENVEQQAEQAFFSRLLLEEKGKHPDKILLLPVAANLNLSSVELIKQKYNVIKFPAIIVDGNTVIGNVVTSSELERQIFNATLSP